MLYDSDADEQTIGEGGYDQTTFTVLSRHDNGEDWPNGQVTITSLVEGALADRIRRRLDTHPRTPVVIEETQTDGGYSEWTRETDHHFELRVGNDIIDLDSYSYNTVDALSRWLDTEN